MAGKKAEQIKEKYSEGEKGKSEQEKKGGRERERGREGKTLDKTERMDGQGGGANDNERVISL